MVPGKWFLYNFMALLLFPSSTSCTPTFPLVLKKYQNSAEHINSTIGTNHFDINDTYMLSCSTKKTNNGFDFQQTCQYVHTFVFFLFVLFYWCFLSLSNVQCVIVITEAWNESGYMSNTARTNEMHKNGISKWINKKNQTAYKTNPPLSLPEY